MPQNITRSVQSRGPVTRQEEAANQSASTPLALR